MKPYASYKPSGVPWLGDVPSHWQVEKVKFQARLRGEKAVGTNGARYVGMEHVLSKVGKFNPVVEGTQEEAESTVNVFSKGDVLFGKLRPYLAKCVVADTDGVCSSEFLVLAPSDEVAPAYLNATMLMQEFIDAVDASTFGAKMPRADWGFIGQQRLPLPPPDEQQAIADYLDAETARIDTLIHEKDELIGLLREWRQSVIVEAVTKGLNKDASMKASGVAVLGEVPSHWEVKKIRYVLEAIGDVDHFMPESVDKGVPYLMTGDLKDLVSEVSLDDCKQVAYKDYLALSKRIKSSKGDVVMARYATIGTAMYVDMDIDFLVSYSCVTLKPNQSNMSGLYLFQYMKSDAFLHGVENQINTNTQGNVGISDLQNVMIAVPPLPEQQAIADYLDAETAKIDDLIAHTNDEIALLKELRAATIADAVLGRVDVRTKN